MTDLHDHPSLLGIAATLAAFVLPFKSPKMLRSATMIEANEARTILSFVFVFALMAACYLFSSGSRALSSKRNRRGQRSLQQANSTYCRNLLGSISRPAVIRGGNPQ